MIMTVDYEFELNNLVETLLKQNSSDMHFSVGHKPIMRTAGKLLTVDDCPVLTTEDVLGFASVLLSEYRKTEFEEEWESDFSYQTANDNRFRGHIFYQNGNPGIVLRHIPNVVKDIDELNLPAILHSFAQMKQGFFLCVGPVGQGKSTTLASLVEYINQNKFEHIVTVEDPVEYIYIPKKSIINQREVGVDTKSFETGLHAAFRQDVNVILVGEMRSRETIATAVTAAETGHLVLSTMHTNNAAQSINRIIDSMPGETQDQVRMQLAGSLVGIFSQRLVPTIDGSGRVPAFELLVNNNAVANLIREDRIHEINSVIETGLEHGMLDMNRSLVDLVKKGIISVESAFTHSFNPKSLERLI